MHSQYLAGRDMDTSLLVGDPVPAKTSGVSVAIGSIPVCIAPVITTKLVCLMVMRMYVEGTVPQ